jgi:hypothetical protein
MCGQHEHQLGLVPWPHCEQRESSMWGQHVRAACGAAHRVQVACGHRDHSCVDCLRNKVADTAWWWVGALRWHRAEVPCGFGFTLTALTKPLLTVMCVPMPVPVPQVAPC